MTFSKHAAAQAFFAQVAPPSEEPEKTANVAQAAGQVAKQTFGQTVGNVVKHPAFWGPVALMGAGRALDAGADALQRIQSAKAKGQAFQQMIAQNPGLRERQPEHVQKFFNTLFTVNPQLAMDPTVAGRWVDMHARQEEIDPQVGAQHLMRSVGEMAQTGAAMSRSGGRSGPGVGSEWARFLIGTTGDTLKTMSGDAKRIERLEQDVGGLNEQKKTLLDQNKKFRSALQNRGQGTP